MPAAEHFLTVSAVNARTYCQRKNKSVSGLIAAFQGFFVKAGMGLASAVIGLLLKKGGYVANTAQTPKALAYIEASFIWIPKVLCVFMEGVP